MAGARTKPEPEEQDGAPEWMVTFSDCMTLLLTFFVLLLSFSSFDDKIHRQMRETMFMDLPTIYCQVRRQRDAVAQAEQIVPEQELDLGSEKPTLVHGRSGSIELKHVTKSFRDRKVFAVSSDAVFWGKSALITPGGNTVLATLARFLNRIPGRVVIAETGSETDSDGTNVGLERSWSVLQNLVARQKFDQNRISIAATSTLATSTEIDRDSRWLEIVLLERSVSN